MSSPKSPKLSWYHINRKNINQKRREQYQESKNQQSFFFYLLYYFMHKPFFLSFLFRSQLGIKNYIDESYDPNCNELNAMETENCNTTVEEDRKFILFNNDKIAYDTMVNEADQDLEEKQSHLYIENDDEQKDGILLMNHEDGVSDECEIDDILQCNLDVNEKS
jgi:hypothetical protein